MLDVKDRQAIVAKALVEVNKARAGLDCRELGSMPIATPGSYSDCAVQRGLRDLAPQCKVMAGSITFTSQACARRVHRAWYGYGTVARVDKEVTLPPAIVDFISHFDSFGLPEMIDPTTFVKLCIPTEPDALARWEAARNWLMRHGKLPEGEVETIVTDEAIQAEIIDAASDQVQELVGV